MPLRPLKPDGQPKLDKELSADERATQAAELLEDGRMGIARAHRHAVDLAALANYQRGQKQ